MAFEMSVPILLSLDRYKNPLLLFSDSIYISLCVSLSVSTSTSLSVTLSFSISLSLSLPFSLSLSLPLHLSLSSCRYLTLFLSFLLSFILLRYSYIFCYFIFWFSSCFRFWSVRIKLFYIQLIIIRLIISFSFPTLFLILVWCRSHVHFAPLVRQTPPLWRSSVSNTNSNTNLNLNSSTSPPSSINSPSHSQNSSPLTTSTSSASVSSRTSQQLVRLPPVLWAPVSSRHKQFPAQFREAVHVLLLASRHCSMTSSTSSGNSSGSSKKYHYKSFPLHIWTFILSFASRYWLSNIHFRD